MIHVGDLPLYTFLRVLLLILTQPCHQSVILAHPFTLPAHTMPTHADMVQTWYRHGRG